MRARRANAQGGMNVDPMDEVITVKRPQVCPMFLSSPITHPFSLT